MDRLYIKATENTPKIDFNPSLEQFEISGKSIPEDSLGFYNPVMDWLEEYAKSPSGRTVFSFKLEYFNTSSSKVILDILYILEKISGLVVNWYYDEDDEDMEETASEFNEVVDFEINLVINE
jgi:hypothetical protein